MTKQEAITFARAIEQAATAPLLAMIAELEQAGKRVTDAFWAYGVSTPWTRESDRTRAECEAAMLALDAAMREDSHG